MPKGTDVTTERNRWSSRLKTVTTRIEKVEQGLVTLILALIILLASLQIGIRWFGSGGLPWIDPLLKYSVLWGGFLGAVLATSRSQHISLDAVDYLMPEKIKPGLKLLTLCFSAVVAALLFHAALLFLISEMEFGGSSLFGLPFWTWYLVFPLSFGMMSVHFTLSALLTALGKRPTTARQSSPGNR